MADIISTRSVWPYYDASNVQAAAAKPKDNSLGKDEFLKILITQLTNQNPMEPLSNSEYIAQMAQFSSVEQLTNISSQMAALSQNLGLASSLIGKTIAWTDTNTAGESTARDGVVDSIVIRGGTQFAIVGNYEVDLTKITAMRASGGESSGV